MREYHRYLTKLIEKNQISFDHTKQKRTVKIAHSYKSGFDLQQGFPILTTRRISFKEVALELIWFLKKETNIKYLVRNSCNKWNREAYRYYTELCKKQNAPRLKPIPFMKRLKGYTESTLEGYSFGDCFSDTDRPKFHNLNQLIFNLIEFPTLKKHSIRAWSSLGLSKKEKSPNDCLMKFSCRRLTVDERLHFSINYGAAEYFIDCEVYQESSDVLIDIPHSTASYALLTHMVAGACNMIPGKLTHCVEEGYIQENCTNEAKKLLSRDYSRYCLPTLGIDKRFTENCKYNKDITIDSNTTYKDFKLFNYQHYPHISIKENAILSL